MTRREKERRVIRSGKKKSRETGKYKKQRNRKLSLKKFYRR
jgi:hypothetical protein